MPLVSRKTFSTRTRRRDERGDVLGILHLLWLGVGIALIYVAIAAFMRM